MIANYRKNVENLFDWTVRRTQESDKSDRLKKIFPKGWSSY